MTKLPNVIYRIENLENGDVAFSIDKEGRNSIDLQEDPVTKRFFLSASDEINLSLFLLDAVRLLSGSTCQKPICLWNSIKNNQIQKSC